MSFLGAGETMASKREQEWEALAKQVAGDLERERQSRVGEEDDTDDDTEFYAEVALEESDALLDLAPPTGFQHVLQSKSDEELELDDPESLGPELTEAFESLELDEPEEAPWLRLHPASLFVNLVPRTWKTLIGMWPLLLLVIVGGSRAEDFALADFAWVGLFLLSGLGSTVIHYLTLRYRVNGNKLEINQGLLNRQARVIDPARIQNVGEVRNIFHNLTGLVEVRLETAGDVRTEGLLSALSVQDAKELIAALEAARGRAPREELTEEEMEKPLLALGVGELLAFGLSKASAGLVAVVLAVGLELVPLFSPEDTASTLENLSPVAAFGGLLVTLVLSWMGSASLSVIRHFRYTLRRVPDEDPRQVALTSKEGLFTTKRMRVPLGKVQLVMVDEPVLRRAMGFGTLNVETAGLGSVQEGVSAAELVVPMVDRDELPGLTQIALPGLDVNPWQVTLNPAHPRALYRMMVSGTLQGLGLSALAVWLLPGWFALLAFGVLPVIWLTRVLDWRAQGWLVTPDVVLSRRGFWRRRTWVMSRNKLQSVHLAQGPWMRFHGIGRLAVRVAGSQVVLPDIGWDDATALLDELRPLPALDLE
ncbi:MAG: putative membrane protein [Cognaticolwellia sp.]|jgi:putative membrane protein